MRSSLVPRRVLGLAAAGVLGLSTLAVPGIALAEIPADTSAGTSSSADTSAADTSAADTPAADPSAADSSSDATTAPAGTSNPSGSSTPEVAAASAPAVPYLNMYPEGVDGGLDLNFVDNSVAPDLATGFEGRANGGAWTPLTDVEVIDGRTYGVLGGLTNGTSYTVEIRAVNASGASAASNSITATPYKPIGAPTGVTVARSATGVTVTWGDPTTAGTYPLDSYSVVWDTGQSGDEGCGVGPTVHTCTFTLPTGDDYRITVLAIDGGGNFGDRAQVQSGAVPAPAAPTAVPTKDDGDVTGPAGPISALTAGQQVVLKGDGFLAGSAVRLTMFSAPVDLGTAVVASDGTFTATVTVPAGLTNGTHHLVATGVDAQGNVRNLIITVTVSGGQAVATLATTGFDAVPVAIGGALVLLVGGGLVVGGRRRKA